MSKTKYKTRDQMNPRHQQMSDIIHQIAKQSFEQTWDIMALHLNKFTPMSGDEGLSMISTLASDILARFIVTMHSQIASKDDTGYSMQDMQDAILEGVTHQLETKLKVKEPKSNIGEIKRISVK